MRHVAGLALGALVVGMLPLVAAWMLKLVPRLPRLTRRGCRAALAFARGQLRAVSSRRMWSFTLGQVAALLLFLSVILNATTPLVLVAALLIYPLFVWAAAMSMLACLHAARLLWGDVFFKIFLAGVQLVLLYYAKGLAAHWIGSLWQVNPAILPLAYAAGTAFALLMLSAALALAPIVVFMTLFLAALWAPAPVRPRGRVRMAGLACSTFVALFGLWMVYGAALATSGSRVGQVLLAAVAFEYDAVPAGRCRLDARDQLDAAGPEPRLKVWFLDGASERALTVRRAADLHKPFVLRDVNAGRDERKNLVIGPAVSCYGAR